MLGVVVCVLAWSANGCNNSQKSWDLQCIVGRIQPISLCKLCVMSVGGPNNVGRAVQTDPTLLRYASAITEQNKCWELLAEKFDWFQTLRKNIQHWELLANNVASVCTGLNTSNVIYLVECHLCNLQYIVEPKRRLKDRFNEHRRPVFNPSDSYIQTTVKERFLSFSHMLLIPVENIDMNAFIPGKHARRTSFIKPELSSLWEVKPRANGRNIVGCYMLCPFAHPVAFECCVLWRKVWSRSNISANNSQHFFCSVIAEA